MPRLFVIFAPLLLLFALTAAENAPDTKDENLVGPVHSVDTRMTQSSGIEGDNDLTRQLDIVTYDPKGYEEARTVYDDFGFPAARQVVARDPDGRRTGSVLSDAKGKLLERQAYVYVDGRLTEIVDRDDKGRITLRQVSTYGSDGRVRDVTYFAEGKPVGKTVYDYDAQGRGSQVAYYMADGSKAVAPIGPCLGAHRITYEYDGKGRPAKVVSYEPHGSLKKSWRYSYNPKGDLAQELIGDEWSDETWTHSYEYDSRGNWIKRTAIISDTPKKEAFSTPGLETMGPSERRMIHSRTITYY